MMVRRLVLLSRLYDLTVQRIERLLVSDKGSEYRQISPMDANIMTRSRYERFLLVGGDATVCAESPSD